MVCLGNNKELGAPGAVSGFTASAYAASFDLKSYKNIWRMTLVVGALELVRHVTALNKL